MKTYSEKFNGIHHAYLMRKMHKLSIGNEGIFDLFKRKKEEEEVGNSIEDFVKLFSQQLDVVEKEAREADKEEWVISSVLLGTVKSAADLIKSAKGQVSFLNDLEKAQGKVVEGIRECNALAKKWAVDYENVKLINGGYDKLIAGYKVTYKNFPSLVTYKKENSAISLMDKFETFFVRMNYSETTRTSNDFEDIEEILYSFADVPGIHADFKFSRGESATISLTKQEFLSFVGLLKEINKRLMNLYKDHLSFSSSKIYAEIKNTIAIYENLMDGHKDPGLDTLINSLLGIEENYADGTYTVFCQTVTDAYVRYIHSFLNKQSKP